MRTSSSLKLNSTASGLLDVTQNVCIHSRLKGVAWLSWTSSSSRRIRSATAWATVVVEVIGVGEEEAEAGMGILGAGTEAAMAAAMAKEGEVERMAVEGAGTSCSHTLQNTLQNQSTTKPRHEKPSSSEVSPVSPVVCLSIVICTQHGQDLARGGEAREQGGRKRKSVRPVRS